MPVVSAASPLASFWPLFTVLALTLEEPDYNGWMTNQALEQRP